MITPHFIEEGFFKGCTIYENDELPQDVFELHTDDFIFRCNTTTGEMTKRRNVIHVYSSQ